jgi:hypothetical protein
MTSREDLEGFIDRMGAEGVQAEEAAPGLWVLKSPGKGDFAVGVHYLPPVVVLRVQVMKVPSDGKRADLYRHLLELNARDVLHGSYGVDGEDVVLSDALELENLDFNEFQASFDSITMSLTAHLPTFAPFRTA